MADLIRVDDAYEVFSPLMEHFGAICSPRDFYWAVNDALHAAEAEEYDQRHAHMFAELEHVWERLLGFLPEQPQRLAFLDVGCGTGLVGGFVSSLCRQRVEVMDLLDPSEEMLKEVSQSAKTWGFKTNTRHGDIDGLQGEDGQYDVVTINSVLHHVVELQALLEKVQNLLKPGGILLTAQDPRNVANTQGDSILQARKAAVSCLQKKTPLRKKAREQIGRTVRQILCIRHDSPLAMRASKTLLESRVISRPMDESSLYAVTDVHVPGLPASIGKGVDVDDLKRWMPDMHCQATYTYSFHGICWTQLTQVEQEREIQWWHDNDPHGTQMACVFRKFSG